MDTVRVLSTLAVRGAFSELVERFQAATGANVDADFSPTLALLDRLRGGEAADVVILTREGLSEMPSGAWRRQAMSISQDPMSASP